MIDYVAILIRRYKGEEWSLNGEEYEGLTWHSNTTKPSKQELDNLWESVQEEIEEEKIAKQTAKELSLQKLEALGLTIEEIKTLLN
jgi:hypothetical protein